MSTALYLGADTTTSGNWIGVHGASGQYFRDGAFFAETLTDTFPSGWTVSLAGATAYSDFGVGSNFLQSVTNPGTRTGAFWFAASGTSITLTVVPPDGSTYQLALYNLDDGSSRGQTVTVEDHGTAAVLDTETHAVGSMSAGIWDRWSCTGPIDLVITGLSTQCMIQGLFLDLSSGGGGGGGPAAGPAALLMGM